MEMTSENSYQKDIDKKPVFDKEMQGSSSSFLGRFDNLLDSEMHREFKKSDELPTNLNVRDLKRKQSESEPCHKYRKKSNTSFHTTDAQLTSPIKKGSAEDEETHMIEQHQREVMTTPTSVNVEERKSMMLGRTHPEMTKWGEGEMGGSYKLGNQKSLCEMDIGKYQEKIRRLEMDEDYKKNLTVRPHKSLLRKQDVKTEKLVGEKDDASSFTLKVLQEKKEMEDNFEKEKAELRRKTVSALQYAARQHEKEKTEWKEREEKMQEQISRLQSEVRGLEEARSMDKVAFDRTNVENALKVKQLQDAIEKINTEGMKARLESEHFKANITVFQQFNEQVNNLSMNNASLNFAVQHANAVQMPQIPGISDQAMLQRLFPTQLLPPITNYPQCLLSEAQLLFTPTWPWPSSAPPTFGTLPAAVVPHPQFQTNFHECGKQQE